MGERSDGLGQAERQGHETEQASTSDEIRLVAVLLCDIHLMIAARHFQACKPTMSRQSVQTVIRTR